MTDMDTLMEAGRLRKELEQSTNHAMALAIYLHSQHGEGRPFVPADTLPGLLSQIDSITQGLKGSVA